MENWRENLVCMQSIQLLTWTSPPVSTLKYTSEMRRKESWEGEVRRVITLGTTLQTQLSRKRVRSQIISLAWWNILFRVLCSIALAPIVGISILGCKVRVDFAKHMELYVNIVLVNYKTFNIFCWLNLSILQSNCPWLGNRLSLCRQYISPQ